MKKNGRCGRGSIHTGVVITCTIIILIGLISCAGAAPVDIEYYYLKDCSDCDYIKPIITGMECDLGSSIVVMYIDVRTPDGLDSFRRHGFHEVPAVVVNGTIQIPKEELTEENIRAAIERVHLETDMGEAPSDIDWNILLAYSFGLFSGFSPCLMAILGFILTYVTGSCKGLRNSILNSLIFGLGLVGAYIVMGSCVLLAGMSFGGFGPYITVVAGVITILVGANLMGWLKIFIDTNTYIQSSVRKYSTTLAGLFFLGMLFSFVKVPCAAPMLLILLSKILIGGRLQDLSLLLVFGAGVLTPFIGVGIIGGYGSSSKIREYRDKLKPLVDFS